jgi:hypothetical protein
MPPNAARNAPIYAERLSVPVRWWLITAAGVVVAGAELAPGFDWWVAVAIFAALAVLMTALLLKIGGPAVRVDAEGLHAGGQTLAPDEMAAAAVLDADETRRWLGPGADPAAHLVARGYIRQSVLVRPVDPATVPYWLVSTRHPEQLLAALTREPLAEPDPAPGLS